MPATCLANTASQSTLYACTSFLCLHSGLVPLHNACSYGHYEVAEQLVKHMTNVNVVDLWKFTPLHEAAAKGKYEICRLLLKVGKGWNTCQYLLSPSLSPLARS